MLHALKLIDYADEAAALHWPEEVEDRSKVVMPGDNVEMLCDLHNPIAIENGQRFNIREGGRTVSSTSNSFSQGKFKIARRSPRLFYSCGLPSTYK